MQRTDKNGVNVYWGRSSLKGQSHYIVGHKKRGTLLLSLFLPIIDQFKKCFSLAHSADNLQ